MKAEYILKSPLDEDEMFDKDKKWLTEIGAVRLVRCKDCRSWHESETYKGHGACGQANGITLKPSDGFCDDGEVKQYE